MWLLGHKPRTGMELFGPRLIKWEGWIHDGVFDSKVWWRPGDKAEEELSKWETASFGLKFPGKERPGSTRRVDQHSLLKNGH